MLKDPRTKKTEMMEGLFDRAKICKTANFFGTRLRKQPRSQVLSSSRQKYQKRDPGSRFFHFLFHLLWFSFLMLLAGRRETLGTRLD